LIWPIIFFFYFWQYHRDKVDELRTAMANEMEMQIRANQQLAAYRKRDLLHQFFRLFIEREEIVQGIQLYKYSLKKNSKEIVVRVEHVNGHVHEGVQLNSLEQIYYYLDKQLYKDFIAAKARLDKSNKIDPLIYFVMKHQSRFTGINPNQQISEYEATQFSVLQLAVDLIEEWFSEQYGHPIGLLIGLPQETWIKLNEAKRTGILRAILLQKGYYRFSHAGDGEKKGRLYLASHIFLWELNHVFLITMDPDVLEEETAHEELDKLQNRFKMGLYKFLSVEYNEEKDAEEGDLPEQAK